MESYNLGKKISSLRKSYSMTQKQLANLLHVSNKVVSKWELNQSEPDIVSLKEIANIFNISIDELLGNSVPLNNEKPENFNEKAYNFFKKHYLTIIQYLLSLFALLAAIIGYSILMKNIFSPYSALLLGFSIATILVEIFIFSSQNKSKGILALKFIYYSFTCIFFIINLFFFIFLSYDFKEICAVGFIWSFFVIVNSILNILKDLNLIKSSPTIKFGKIVVALLYIFLAVQCLLCIGNIGAATDMYVERLSYEVGYRALTLYKQSYNFYNVGDTQQIKHAYPLTIYEQKMLSYQSLNESIVSVTSSGMLTAQGYGETKIILSCSGRSAEIYVVVSKTTEEDISQSTSFKEVYANQTLDIELNNLDGAFSLDNCSLVFYVRDKYGNNSNLVEVIGYKPYREVTVRIKDKTNTDPDFVNIIVYDKVSSSYVFSQILKINSICSMPILADSTIYVGNSATSDLRKLVDVPNQSLDNLVFEIRDKGGKLCSDLTIGNPKFNGNTLQVLAFANSLTSSSKNVFVLVYDKSINQYTHISNIEIKDVLSININNLGINFYVGEAFEIDFSYSPSAVKTNFVIESSNSSIIEIIDNKTLYVKSFGTVIIKVTAQNGVTEQKEITVNEKLSINSIRAETSTCKVGDEIEVLLSIKDLKIPYILKCRFKTTEITNIYFSQDDHYLHVTLRCLEAGNLGCYLDIMVDNEIVSSGLINLNVES